MLKINIKRDGGPNIIMVRGSLKDILVDLMRVINGVYNQFKKNDPAIARAFQYALIGAMADPDSPMWEASHEPVVGVMYTEPGEGQ